MNNRINIPKKLRFNLLLRDNFTCQYCGSSAPQVELQIDHFIPVSRGGKNSETNLLVSCQECNASKSDTLVERKKVFRKESYGLRKILLERGIIKIDFNNEYGNFIYCLRVFDELFRENLMKYSEEVLFSKIKDYCKTCKSYKHLTNLIFANLFPNE